MSSLYAALGYVEDVENLRRILMLGLFWSVLTVFVIARAYSLSRER